MRPSPSPASIVSTSRKSMYNKNPIRFSKSEGLQSSERKKQRWGESGAFSQLEDSILAAVLPTTCIRNGRSLPIQKSGQSTPKTHPSSSRCFLTTIINLDLSQDGQGLGHSFPCPNNPAPVLTPNSKFILIESCKIQHPEPSYPCLPPPALNFPFFPICFPLFFFLVYTCFPE